jgi:hypothetical protein
MPDNRTLKDFYVFPRIDPPSKLEVKDMRKRMFRIKENDLWLKGGKKITNLSKLWDAARVFRSA